MGVEVDCCRRPQGLGKKDLKTYRGIHQKKSKKRKIFDDDDKDNFGTYNPGKNNSEYNTNDYFNSVYANKNDFFSNTPYQNLSNYNIEPVSNQYSNYTEFPTTQTQDYTSQPQYDNAQYINSYPQQNYISQSPIIETIPTTQYTTSQPEYHSETNNYVKTLPTKYISSNPNQYTNYSTNQYNNSSPIEYDNSSPIEYDNSSPIEYDNSLSTQYEAQPVQYLNSQNIESTKYIKSKPISYVENNNNIQMVKYETPIIQEAQYNTSHKEEYVDSNSHNYTNYETQQTYAESSPQSNIEYVSPKNEYLSPSNTYGEMSSALTQNTNSNSTTKYEEAQYIESSPTQYLTSKPKYEEVQYIESPSNQYIDSTLKYEDQNQYIESSSSTNHYIDSKPQYEEIQYNEPKEQIQYVSPPIETHYIEPQIIKKVYISKPKQYIERQQQYTIEPQGRHYPNQNDDCPETQKEPEDLDLSEAEPQSFFPPKNMKKKRRSVKYSDSEEDKDVNNIYDEIKEDKDYSHKENKRFYPSEEPSFKRQKEKKNYKVDNDNDNEDDEDNESDEDKEEDELESEKPKFKGHFKNNKFNGQEKIILKEDESEYEGEFRDEEIEKKNIKVIRASDRKDIKSATIEKKKENTACQVPGFISNFFSKIFD